MKPAKSKIQRTDRTAHSCAFRICLDSSPFFSAVCECAAVSEVSFTYCLGSEFHVYMRIRFYRHVWRQELNSKRQRASARRRKYGWLERATSPTNLSSKSYWYFKRRTSEDAKTVKRKGERDRNTKMCYLSIFRQSSARHVYQPS